MPLETPTMPSGDVSSEVNKVANTRIASGESAHDLELWAADMNRYHDKGITVNRPKDNEATIDIYAEESDTTGWISQREIQEPVAVIEEIEARLKPLSRPQELEVTYNYLNDPQRVETIRATTQALIIERSLV